MKYGQSDIKEFIKTCERAIQEGDGPSLKSKLTRLNSAKVPGSLRLPLSNICRRIGLVKTGIRILSPRISMKKLGTELDTTDAELLEYAVQLQRIGANANSHQVLDMIDSNRSPKVYLHKALGYFHTWDHLKAIPLLKEYLKTEMTNYELLIARLNLALCFCILGDYDESAKLAQLCAEETLQTNKLRLHANCLELLTQIHILKGDLKSARNYHKGAIKILTSNQTFDGFYVRKWQAFFESIETSNLGPLDKFQKEAQSCSYWEAYRDAELFKLLVQFDDNRFHRLYIGSPYQGYRDRITRCLNGQRPNQDYYYSGNSKGQVIDLYACNWQEDDFFPMGKNTHQLIETLSRDLFRPHRIEELFSLLYPNEFYDLDTSPTRVYKAISRANSQIEEKQIPISIVQNNGFYSLSLDDGVCLKLHLQAPRVDGHEAYINKMKYSNQFDDLFSSSEMSRWLKIKSSMTRDILHYGVQHSKIEKIGSGPGTYYKLRVA